MDPVAARSPSEPGAKLLIDLGDDTSNGGSWETFSINSLAREFRGFPIVAVAGNHDPGSSVTETMKDRGFRVLAGRRSTVGGIRFLGSSDPRSSGLAAGYDGDESDNIAAITEQDKTLTEVACVTAVWQCSWCTARRRPGGRPRAAASTSCCPATCTARSVPRSSRAERPIHHDLDDGIDRRRRLRVRARQQAAATAQVTVVTFGDGRPVGLQPVTFEPGGTIDVADYMRVKPSTR